MPRKKIDEEPEEEKYEWDKPRIIIFFSIIIALLIGGLFAKHFLLDAQNAPLPTQQSVQGASANPSDTSSSQLPSVQDVQHGVSQQVAHLQQQAAKINVQEIASSSPQVQQVIQQLQQLPSLPSDVAKQTCEQLCGKL